MEFFFEKIFVECLIITFMERIFCGRVFVFSRKTCGTLLLFLRRTLGLHIFMKKCLECNKNSLWNFLKKTNFFRKKNVEHNFLVENLVERNLIR